MYANNDFVKKSELVITKHAYLRMRQRCGWQQATASKMALKAINEGLSHSEFPEGDALRWADSLYFSQRNATNMRYYAESIFLFKKETLLTVIKVPSDLREIFQQKLTKKRKETPKKDESEKIRDILRNYRVPQITMREGHLIIGAEKKRRKNKKKDAKTISSKPNVIGEAAV